MNTLSLVPIDCVVVGNCPTSNNNSSSDFQPTYTMALDSVLCDNTLAHVVLFLDYESTVIFSKKTSQALKHRMSCASRHIWRDIFERHFFSPPEQQEVDYLVECRDRKALLRNLVGKEKERHAVKQSLNLPDRFFYFVPVSASDDDDSRLVHDPPRGVFDCDSFLLTSGCEGEMIFLDPFNMSLVVHKNCVDNALKKNEAMMIQGYIDATSLLQCNSNLGSQGEVSKEHVAGAVIDETVYRSHIYRTPPSQILMEAQDCFNLREDEYSHFTHDRNTRHEDDNGHRFLHPDDQVEFGYMGIDSKTIMGQDGRAQGTCVALGRFCSLNVDVDPVCCAEIITWTRNKGQDMFGDKRICRFPGDYFCIDTCPKQQRTYVVFLQGQSSLLNNDSNEAILGSKMIVAYPSVPADDSTPPTSPQYFSNPAFTLTCSDHVSHIFVDCAGTLLVGTNSGNIEVWKPNAHFGMERVTLLNVKESWIASTKRFYAQTEGSQKGSYVAMNIHDTNQEIQGDDANMACGLPVVTDNLCNLEEEGHGEDSDVHMEYNETAAAAVDDYSEEVWVPRLCGSATVESFHFPDHLPVELCGFVSVQHSHVEGTCLLVWKKPNPGSEFHVVSQITLPLSPRRKPCVHYDGRRIVVCGQDHTGLIVLIYHVLSSMEDIEYFVSCPENKIGEESGGVYNFTVQPYVRFAKSVRHAALGGLHDYDSMHMACNERFLIINTKTGNLLDGGSLSTGEGLLIIDLKEHE